VSDGARAKKDLDQTAIAGAAADAGRARAAVPLGGAGEEASGTLAQARPPTAERQSARVALACRIYQARLDRARFFRCSVFGEAGWDTLLAIYVFAAAGRTLSAGELSNATTETSLTSALRLQRRLADVGLVHRIPHPSDRRRVLVELTPHGLNVLEDYLDHLLENRLSLSDDDYFDHPRLLDNLCRSLIGG